MKTCSRCRETLPLENFCKSKSRKDGHNCYCRPCKAQIHKERGGKDSVTLAAWRKANPEKSKAIHDRYRANNPTKVDAARSKWAEANPENSCIRSARYRKKFPHRVNALNAAYQATKIRATPPWSNASKITECYAAAEILSMVTGDWYHVDHIVPLRSKVVCGLHCEANLRVLHGRDNQSKGNRWWPDMP